MRFFIVFALIFSASVYGKTKDNDKPLEIENTKVVLSKQVDLSKDKLALGKIYTADSTNKQAHSDLVFRGIITKSPQVGSYKVNILWNEYIDGDTVKKISPPLSSALVTKSQVLPADKPFIMKGDIPSNVQAAIDGRKINKSTGQSTTSRETKTNSNDRSLASNNGQRSLRTGSGSSSSTNSSTPTATPEQTLPDVTPDNTITYEACIDRADVTAEVVYEQKSEIITDSTGKIISRGSCTDTGVTKPLTISTYACEPERSGNFLNLREGKIYTANNTEVSRTNCLETGESVAVSTEFLDTCGHTLDLDNNIAYKRINEYAFVNGSRLDLSSCKTDYTTPLNLTATFLDCAISHDLINNRSVANEKYFYTESGQNVYVTACLESSTVYSHSQTENGCTPSVDPTNNRVTIFTQPVYTVDGQEFYPSSCSPSTSTSNLVEEDCSPRYSHDFEGKLTTLLTRFYYNNLDGEKQYTTSCAASSTTYTHTETVSDCNGRYDNVAHTYIQSTKTVIDDNGSIVTIAECGERTDPVPYQTTSTKSFTFSNLDVRTSHTQYAIPVEALGVAFNRSDLSPDPDESQVSFNLNFSGATNYSITVYYRINEGIYLTGLLYAQHTASLQNVNTESTILIDMEPNDTIQFYAVGISNTSTLLPRAYGSLTVTANWN